MLEQREPSAIERQITAERDALRTANSALEAQLQAKNLQMEAMAREVDALRHSLSAHAAHDSTMPSRNDISVHHEAQRVAEEANTATASFLANMSHEIRTPMNAVQGLTHLLLKTTLDDKQRSYLRKIQQSSQHLLGIINDILDFSKIEAGKLSIESVEFSVENVLLDVSDLLADTFQSKNLELVFDIDTQLPELLLGDPLRISQILLNFISNAVKFTERGQIVVQARIIEQSSTDLLLKINVKDSGMGMTPEQVDKMFQPFSQADSSTTRKFGGTGLGLVIAKNLTELMHGEVGVSSTQGIGSTFWFTARMGLTAQKNRKHTSTLLRFIKQRVLVVDDNEVSRISLRNMLEGFGCVVEEAVSGEQALLELTHGRMAPPDMIVMDWQMPGMDGLQTAQRLRNRPLMMDVPILLITSWSEADVSDDPHRDSVNAVLTKPIGASRLFDATAHLMFKTVDHLATPRNLARQETDTAHAESAPTSVPQLLGVRVLLVEDNNINQLVATELLHEFGCVVEVAENGAIALQMLQETLSRQRAPYRVVLMDMQMPVMDGVTATEQIRTQRAFDTLPVIAMTANAMQVDQDRCARAGMNDHISKPVNPSVLQAALVKWIQENALRPTRPATPLAPAQLLQHWNGIAGLDVEDGLPRIAGNAGLYVRLLRKVAESEADCVSRIRSALDNNDLAQAIEIAHSARGSAANLSIKTLAMAAGEVEDGLLANATPAELEPKYVELNHWLLTLLNTVKS